MVVRSEEDVFNGRVLVVCRGRRAEAAITLIIGIGSLFSTTTLDILADLAILKVVVLHEEVIVQSSFPPVLHGECVVQEF